MKFVTRISVGIKAQKVQKVLTNKIRTKSSNNPCKRKPANFYKNYNLTLVSQLSDIFNQFNQPF